MFGVKLIYVTHQDPQCPLCEIKMEEEDVVIVGAGIAGLATAVALKRVRIQALVIEKSGGLRAAGATLSLYPNGWLALDALGVAHKFINLYAPCRR